jgi:sulfur-oxidizing protein SoxZ
MARALVNVPSIARRGDVIEIRALVQHPMETGFRPRGDGTMYPRDIISRFECVYDGETVFAADLHPAIAANPFLSFSTVATVSGEILLRWTDDKGRSQEERVTITVTG